jgi:hypothetical protein
VIQRGIFPTLVVDEIARVYPVEEPA